MRFLILVPLFSTVFVYSAPQKSSEEDLPFSTDNFPTFLDETTSNSAEEKDELALSYSDQAETLKKRLKMKSMFNTNGPPSVGSDLFSSAAVEENVRKLSYEGSGSGVEENSEKSEESITTSTMVSVELSYTANNSTMDEAVIESSSNSSLLYDQNTSDAEVETISDTVYQKNEASAILQASQIESDNKAEEESVVDGAKSTTILDVVDYIGNDTSAKVSCPPPRMCKKNCFVTINENGCQDCQCLWIAADCQVDSDCLEKNQYCDLGKCNCQPGYQQNMRKSGVCEVDSSHLVENTLIESENSKEVPSDEQEEIARMLKRRKRDSKPRRSERLEWPGVCDKNEHCPENLVCIHGDCWSIPEKTKRADEIPKTPEVIISRNTGAKYDHYQAQNVFSSFLEQDEARRISFDTDELMEPSTEGTFSPIALNPVTDSLTETSPVTEAPKRGMSRFVSDDFAKQLRRTTAKIKKYDWFPPTTTITPPVTQFPMTTNHVPPLTVDHFFMIETTIPPATTTTHRKIANDHKMEYMKERKPNFLGVKEEVHDFDYPTTSQSHIKKIHLEMPATPTLLPHRKKHKKFRTTTSTPDDASEVEETSGVDEIEFPISSKIKLGSHKPRALSAEPTREELKDHKSLVDLFNSHAIKAQEPEETSIKPSFQILQSFNSPDPEPVPDLQVPDIQVSLTNQQTSFLPIPDLLNGDVTIPPARKPYIIQHGKFTTIAPLSNISGDMASDDPPEITPQPAPFDQHEMGVWYPMKKGDIPHMGIFSGEFRRAPSKVQTAPGEFRLYNEYTKENRQNRPVRIEMDNASKFFRNECRRNEDCGTKNICCTKKWCDRTNNCGTGRFCLPYCDSTKLTFLPSTKHAESVIDIMYD